MPFLFLSSFVWGENTDRNVVGIRKQKSEIALSIRKIGRVKQKKSQITKKTQRETLFSFLVYRARQCVHSSSIFHNRFCVFCSLLHCRMHRYYLSLPVKRNRRKWKVRSCWAAWLWRCTSAEQYSSLSIAQYRCIVHTLAARTIDRVECLCFPHRTYYARFSFQRIVLFAFLTEECVAKLCKYMQENKQIEMNRDFRRPTQITIYFSVSVYIT